MQYTETNKDAIRTPTTKAKFDSFITRSIKRVTRLFTPYFLKVEIAEKVSCFG